MKVLQISATDNQGGASMVAYSLGASLRQRGHTVGMLVGKAFAGEDWIEPIRPKRIPGDRLLQKVIHRTGLDQFGFQQSFPFHYGARYFRQFDLVHLHDLPPQFNLLGLPWLSRLVPTFWTLHSMWPITGGCSFSFDCPKWKESCGACPQFGKWPLSWLHRDASRASIRLKRLLYRFSPLVVICVSRWLQKCAEDPTFARHRVAHIPNSPDPVFQPENREAARKALGVPSDAFAILFSVSGNPDDTRKGTDLIVQALDQLQDKRVFLLPTGITPPSGDMEGTFKRFEALPVRHIDNRNTMKTYYNAADLFWSPTRADNCPMAILESMACGTPVLAAEVGGVPEILDQGRAGFLIPPNDAGALCRTTEQLLQQPEELSRAGRAGLDRVRRHYTEERLLKQHIDLYAECIQSENQAQG